MDVLWDNESKAGGGGAAGGLTLVHLYNNESTPVPVLRVEIWSSAMGILDNVIGFTGT